MKRFILLSILIFLTGGCTLVISREPENTPPSPATETPVSTDTLTPGATTLPTQTPTPRATDTATPAPTDTPSPTASLSATPISTPNITDTPTLTPATSQPAVTPEPTLAPPPIVTPTTIPTAILAPNDAPRVTESTIVIDTYNYQPALVSTQPDDPVYPYPRMDHNLVQAPSPQTYKSIVLENRYTRLVILPELGGRIYKWIDKASGKNLFYENKIIKPTPFGNRGWWLAVGGMEWALPTDEHGLSEASPWNYELFQDGQQAGVVLSDTEEHSGLISEITITLDGNHNYFTLTPQIFNPNSDSVSYKFWINGMFTLGAPTLTHDIDFVFPATEVTIHSSDDPALPADGEKMSWPFFDGRDLSKYDTWQHYTGFFAAPQAQANFMGAYNRTTNLGVVRVFPSNIATGIKIFAPGDLLTDLWTDDGSKYFELWGGVAPTFWDERTLNSGKWITWQERWYAIGDMGGFAFANDTAALNLGTTVSAVQVAATSTQPMAGTLILYGNGAELTHWDVTLSPTMPFRGSFAAPNIMETEWSLKLIDGNGQTIAELGQAPTVTALAPPPTSTATPIPMNPTPQSTAIPTATSAPPPSGIISNADLVWDTRLNDLGITLDRALAQPGDTVYRLVAARYWDETESEMRHHIFIEVIDEHGRRMLGLPVAMGWADGESIAYTEDKPEPEYAANFPMYDYIGKYTSYVATEKSDMIKGLGLPGKHHVSYLLTFQRQTQ